MYIDAWTESLQSPSHYCHIEHWESFTNLIHSSKFMLSHHLFPSFIILSYLGIQVRPHHNHIHHVWVLLLPPVAIAHKTIILLFSALQTKPVHRIFLRLSMAYRVAHKSSDDSPWDEYVFFSVSTIRSFYGMRGGKQNDKGWYTVYCVVYGQQNLCWNFVWCCHTENPRSKLGQLRSLVCVVLSLRA